MVTSQPLARSVLAAASAMAWLKDVFSECASTIRALRPAGRGSSAPPQQGPQSPPWGHPQCPAGTCGCHMDTARRPPHTDVPSPQMPAAATAAPQLPPGTLQQGSASRLCRAMLCRAVPTEVEALRPQGQQSVARLIEPCSQLTLPARLQRRENAWGWEHHSPGAARQMWMRLSHLLWPWAGSGQVLVLTYLPWPERLGCW